MRIFLAILMSVVFASGAYAGGGGGGGGGQGSSNRISVRFTPTGENLITEEIAADDEDDDDPRFMSLPAVVAPLSRNGRLQGFAYVHMRMRVREGSDAWEARSNAHYALDALIRAAHRTPLANEEGTGLDIHLAAEIWAQTLRDYYGEDVVDLVEIRSADTRLLER